MTSRRWAPGRWLNETVVPASRGNGVLGTQVSHHQLEGGPGIVVEAAHEARVHFKRNIQFPEPRFYSIKVVFTGSAEVIEHDRGISEFISVHLAIQHAKRVGLVTPLAVSA